MKDSVSKPRHQRPSSLDKFLFGAPYYPEHWSAADMEQDASRMVAANMNVVRMGEFAWDLMEPQLGEFDFSVFDETIGRLGAHGISSILCTPTATPPRWLTAANEDWVRVDAQGRRMQHGSRQHVCTNNPGFRSESERITRAMAEHFAQNPHVIGWQTDNEFYCHISECHCPSCQELFRSWLKEKYDNIDALNRAWGSAFWAQTLSSFEEILIPAQLCPSFPNPGQHLDYLRFIGDSLCDFQKGQVDVLREVQPKWWITHNGIFRQVNYWKLTSDLDFLGVDVYPGFSGDPVREYSWASHINQLARAASGSYIVPEQQGGAGGQQVFLLPTPHPGQMRLWAYQSIAHGADGILHFRWRTCRFGAEIYWNGILDHDNVPRRRYEEFAQEGAEFKKLGDKILGTVLKVDAAVLIENEQDDAHTTMSLGLPGPADQRKLVLKQMLFQHWPAGLVQAEDSLEGLRLIFLPSLPLMESALAARLECFVREGGVLVATARTATRDRNNHVISITPPGLLSGLFGITVEEFGSLPEPLLTLEAPEVGCIPVGAGYEILKSCGAETLATWKHSLDGGAHVTSGHAAITLNRVGAGLAIYIGTYFSPGNLTALFEVIQRQAKIQPLADADGVVEITCRHSAGRKLIFVLNHGAKVQTVCDLPQGAELITGQTCNGEIEMRPYDVAVIEAPNEG